MRKIWIKYITFMVIALGRNLFCYIIADKIVTSLVLTMHE